MKLINKIKLIISMCLMVLLAIVCMGCSGGSVASLSVSGAEEIFIGNFDYSAYTVTIVYTDGRTKTMPLDESMIGSYDKIKFYKEGKQVINVSYKERACSFEVKVKRYEFGDDITLSSIDAVYNGNEFSVEVEGNVPEGTNIYYPDGKTFTNAIKNYAVTAVLKNDLFVTKTLNATVNIEKAVIDMSQVKMEDLTVSYDGKPKEIAVENLPSLVNVNYSINGKDGNRQTKVGSYEVTATFEVVNQNYQTPVSMTRTLTIEKADYDMSEIKLEGAKYVYEFGVERPITLQGKLPTSIVASYRLERAGGGSIENCNHATNAGEYTVVVSFYNFDENYNTPLDMEASLVIERANFDMSEVKLNIFQAVYDGEPHSNSIIGELPEGVYVYYTITDSDDVEIDGNSAVNAGEYRVNANFVHTNPNYNPIESLEAIMLINKASFSGIDLRTEDYNYSPNGHSVGIIGDLPQGTEVEYSVVYQKEGTAEETTDAHNEPFIVKELGRYTISANIECLNYTSMTLSAVVTISKATIIPNIEIKEDLHPAEDGSEIELEVADVSGVPEGLAVLYWFDEDNPMIKFNTPTIKVSKYGTHILYWKMNGSEYYKEASGNIEFTIEKIHAAPEITAKALIYSETEQLVVDVVGVPEYVDITYSVDGGAECSTPSFLVNAGTHKLSWKLNGKDVYEDLRGSVQFTVDKKVVSGVSFCKVVGGVATDVESGTEFISSDLPLTIRLNNVPDVITVDYIVERRDISVSSEATGEVVIDSVGRYAISAKFVSDNYEMDLTETEDGYYKFTCVVKQTV